MSPRSFSGREGNSSSRPTLDGVRFGHASSSAPLARPKKALSPTLRRKGKQLDAVLLSDSRRAASSFRVSRLFFFRRLKIRVRRLVRRLERLLPSFDHLTPKRAIYACLVGGVGFGVATTSLFHDFTDQEAAAISPAAVSALTAESLSQAELARELGGEVKYDPNNDIFLQFFNESEKSEYRAQVESLVDGYPIEDMLPYILEKDRVVAAFLIGIAKKESNWGKRVPVLNGEDCFNYWGYRGIRRLMGSGGHTCFNSKKDAVDTVALRLEKLVNSEKLDTPAKMIIWKCGYSCDGHSRESVRKWIADVDMYFSELRGNDEEDGLVMNPSARP